MKEKYTSCSVLFLLVSFLWGAAGALNFPNIKTFNRLDFNSVYNIVPRASENSILFEDVSNNGIVVDDQTFDKFEIKLSAQDPKEKLFKEMIRKKEQEKIESPIEWIKEKEAALKQGDSKLESRKTNGEGQHTNQGSKGDKNELLDRLNVQKSDDDRFTKDANEDYENHSLDGPGAQKTDKTNVEAEFDKTESQESRHSHEQWHSDFIFPKSVNSIRRFHKTHIEQGTPFKVSDTESKRYLREDIINKKILNDANILVKSEEPYDKSQHFLKNLFKEPRKDSDPIPEPTKEESNFKEIRSKTSSESSIFDEIDQVNHESEWNANPAEYSHKMTSAKSSFQSSFIIRPLLIIDDSSFDTVSNKKSASSYEKDDTIHKTSHQSSAGSALSRKRRRPQRRGQSCSYSKGLEHSELKCRETPSNA